MAGTHTGTVGECHFLISWLASYDFLSYFSYINQDHLPRNATAYKGLAHPTSNITQDSAPQTWLETISAGGNSSDDVPFS